MGRKQTKLNVQNPTSTCIRYGDLQWANKTRQSFAHFTSTLFAFILWERVSDFIEGQHLGEHGKIQWNIERTIVDKTNLRRPQIDSFISHTYYEYAYGQMCTGCEFNQTRETCIPMWCSKKWIMTLRIQSKD